MAVLLYDQAMDFATKLRWLMTEQRLSQEKLAQKLDVSQGLVGLWTRSKNIPGLELAIALANTLDVSMDYLFDPRYELMDSEELRCDREIRRIVGEIGPESAWRRLVGGVPSSSGQAWLPGPVRDLTASERARYKESRRAERPPENPPPGAAVQGTDGSLPKDGERKRKGKGG